MDKRLLEVLNFIDYLRYEQLIVYLTTEEKKELVFYPKKLNTINQLAEIKNIDFQTDKVYLLITDDSQTFQQLPADCQVDIILIKPRGYNSAIQKCLSTLKKQGYSSAHYYIGYTVHDARFLVPETMPFSEAFRMTPKGVFLGEVRKKLYSGLRSMGLGKLLPTIYYLQKAREKKARSLVDKALTSFSGSSAVLFNGTPGITRRLTLQSMDAQGEYIYTKVATNEFTTEKVTTEIQTLRSLNAQSWKSFAVPRLIDHGEYAGRKYFSQSSYSLSEPSKQSGEYSEVHNEFLKELYQHSAYEVKLADHSIYQYIIERLSKDYCKDFQPLKIKAVLEPHAALSIKGAAVHGDFTPWNVQVFANKIFIYDWESYSEEGLFYQDFLHFTLQEAVLVKKLTAQDTYKLIEKLISQYPFLDQASGKWPIYLLLYILYAHISYEELIAMEDPGFVQVEWQKRFRKELFNITLKNINGSSIS